MAVDESRLDLGLGSLFANLGLGLGDDGAQSVYSGVRSFAGTSGSKKISPATKKYEWKESGGRRDIKRAESEDTAAVVARWFQEREASVKALYADSQKESLSIELQQLKMARSLSAGRRERKKNEAVYEKREGKVQIVRKSVLTIEERREHYEWTPTMLMHRDDCTCSVCSKRIRDAARTLRHRTLNANELEETRKRLNELWCRKQTENLGEDSEVWKQILQEKLNLTRLTKGMAPYKTPIDI
ncbi:hypothetical protein GUITHDRAFT_107068 [Guillardia theta CCMP2712]|uniref:Uncharacterized protein n=1 Tax=Guillardia theta (strain CCMP2712) TaxID=905079 RepID=L1JFQ4_GUITC|nr:hypothetical protein GUITHDRAFT_107068 [Guillardia theta CCMP2712]EKX47157.1 hypothetical protein GUITHDRAFT_107068 [Guillardia theta CCMP2712]|eukprot:XP_005834137.1 hypothetical protein GUITHDRAFT_107068 [Guillardia theta CCMP2712]